jgi:hypothetical protein
MDACAFLRVMHAFIIIVMHAACLLSAWVWKTKKDFVELVRSHKDAFTPMLVLYSKLHKVFEQSLALP